MITSFPKKVIEYAKTAKKFYFIQIGAHDGVKHDPIHQFILKYNWVGVLIEPIPEYFEKLKQTYSKFKNLTLLNVAISENSGWRTMYGVSSRAPKLIWELARTKDSFSKKVLMRRTWYIPFLSRYVISKKIRCSTLSKIYLSSKINHVDFLVIDTEGYDYEILKQVNFKNLRPKFIYYEHLHLSDNDTKASRSLLLENGYAISNDYKNTFAYVNKSEINQ